MASLIHYKIQTNFKVAVQLLEGELVFIVFHETTCDSKNLPLIDAALKFHTFFKLLPVILLVLQRI